MCDTLVYTIVFAIHPLYNIFEEVTSVTLYRKVTMKKIIYYFSGTGNSLHAAMQIAKMLGMSQTGYSKYETGENDIPTAVLIKLADFYRTTTDYLLGRTNVKEPYPKAKK